MCYSTGSSAALHVLPVHGRGPSLLHLHAAVRARDQTETCRADKQGDSGTVPQVSSFRDFLEQSLKFSPFVTF